MISARKELDLAAEPFAVDGGCVGHGDAEKFWRANDDGGGRHLDGFSRGLGGGYMRARVEHSDSSELRDAGKGHAIHCREEERRRPADAEEFPTAVRVAAGPAGGRFGSVGARDWTLV